MSDILCKGMQSTDKDSVVTDLCVKAADIQLPDIHEDDLAVIAMPVFAGRVPRDSCCGCCGRAQYHQEIWERKARCCRRTDTQRIWC